MSEDTPGPEGPPTPDPPGPEDGGSVTPDSQLQKDEEPTMRKRGRWGRVRDFAQEHTSELVMGALALVGTGVAIALSLPDDEQNTLSPGTEQPELKSGLVETLQDVLSEPSHHARPERHYVDSHTRNVAYGPGHSLRREQEINGYFRGVQPTD